MVLHCLDDGTARFMGVGAVGELAVLREPEYLLEVAGEFLLLYIEGSEALDARSIDEIAALWQGEHLAEGGSMHSAVVRLADFCGALGSIGDELVDERGFSHAAVAAKQRLLVLDERAQFVNSFTCGCRDFHALVSDGFIEGAHHFLVVQLLLGEQVALVEHDDDGHSVCLGSSQESVDEGGGSLRVIHGNHKQRLIEISRKDVTLLAEVG